MNPRTGAAAAAAIIIAALLSACAGADDEFDAESFVMNYYSKFQSPGFYVDDLMEYYSDDVIFEDPTFEIAVSGKDEVRKLYAEVGTGRTAYKNINWGIARVVSDGGTIVIRGSWAGSFQDCDFDVEFMTLWRVENEKIVEQNDFFASGTFDRQVGWDGSGATCGQKS